MTSLIHAGAVPVHCPRMPSGVWGSISISYLCRLLLWGPQTLMSAFLSLKRSPSHTRTHIHTFEAYRLAKAWGPCCHSLQWSDHLALFLSLSPVSQRHQHRWHSLIISLLGKEQPEWSFKQYTHTQSLKKKKNLSLWCSVTDYNSPLWGCNWKDKTKVCLLVIAL